MIISFRRWLVIKNCSPHLNENKNLLFILIYSVGLLLKILALSLRSQSIISNSVYVEVPNSKYLRFTTSLDNSALITTGRSFESVNSLYGDFSRIHFLKNLFLSINKVRPTNYLNLISFCYRYSIAKRLLEHNSKLFTFDGLSPLSVAHWSQGGQTITYRPTTTYKSLENRYLYRTQILIKSKNEIDKYFGLETCFIGTDLTFVRYCSLFRREEILLIDTVPNISFPTQDYILNQKIVLEALAGHKIHYQFHPGLPDDIKNQITSIIDCYPSICVVSGSENNYRKVISYDSTLALEKIWAGCEVGILSYPLAGNLQCSYNDIKVELLTSTSDIHRFLNSSGSRLREILLNIENERGVLAYDKNVRKYLQV